MNLLAASQHRQVASNNQEDRVYRTMQISDLKPGKSSPAADPAHHSDIGELEDKLAAALLEKYPVMSRIHTHSRMASPGKAWRFSHTFVIPNLHAS